MRLTRSTLLATLIALLFVAGAQAAPVVETLDNGCRLVVEADRSRPVAAFRLYVRAGSIYEGQWLGGGITHFLEHTISEGTPTRSLAEIEATLDDLGNTYNAYTTKDHTCYYISAAGEDIARAIDVVSDFVLHPTFPPEEVETQRGIILREMAMGDDDPGRRIHDLLAETVFTQHPYRYRIIGYPEVFTQIMRDDLVAYHRQFYGPDNIVAVAVGDFDADDVLAQLREIFGAAARRPRPSLELTQEPTQIAPRHRVETDPNLQRAYLQIAWPTISIFSPDLYPLDTLSYYLSGGESSVLVRRLRDELGLVDVVYSYSATPAYDAGYFVIGAVCDPANLDRVEQEIIAEIERVQQHAPDRRDIERVRRQVAAGEIFGQETAEGRAETLGANLMVTGDVNFADRYVAGIRAVEPRQVRQMAERYLVPDHTCVAILRPGAEAATDTRPDRRTAEARTLERALDNGLRVVVRENHTTPTVSVTTATLGGLRYETADTAGITALMADMLTHGTRRMSREDIVRRVDRLGGSLEPYSGRNTFGVNAHFLAEDLDAALELTAETLFHPTFPADEFAREQQLTLAAIQGQEDSVETVAFRALLGEVFTLHPYRFLPVGTAESVAALTPEALVEFHRAYALPSATAFVVAGDVDPDAVFAQVERLTAGLSATPPQPPTPPAQQPIEQRREQTIERVQQQAIVAYGFRSPVTVNDPRRPALDVLDAIISGSGMPGGRLHEALRGQQLVYFVHGMPLLGLDPGAFIIYAGTAPDRVAEVRGEIERIVTDIAASPPAADELALGKRMAITSEEMALQTNAAVAQTIALDVVYDQGAEYWEGYAERVNAVTAAQVQQLAAGILDLQRSAMVVTTPGAAQ